MNKEATLSDCGLYRYTLERSWGIGRRVLFVMLNPSTADGCIDDPTTRRCIGYAKAWGFASLCLVNLFAFRSSSPGEMKKAKNPVGPENDNFILAEIKKSDLVVAAWGGHGSFMNRDKEVLSFYDSWKCLSVTKKGNPGHPLYLGASLTPSDYLCNKAVQP